MALCLLPFVASCPEKYLGPPGSTDHLPLALLAFGRFITQPWCHKHRVGLGATELLKLLENICCAEFLLRCEDEALCSRFDAAPMQECISGLLKASGALALDLAKCFRVRNGMQLDHRSRKFGATTDIPFRQRCIKQPSVLSSMPRRGFGLG